MATVMLVADTHAAEPVVGPDAAERLASLGITRITLLRDPISTAVVLEGWAFDPARTPEATRAVFPADGASLRTYHEVQYVGVSSAQKTREKQWHTSPDGSGSSS
jgi:hypothetical protein